MKLTNRPVATAFGVALLFGAGAAVTGSAQAQEGQGAVIPPTVNEVPSSQHQQNVLTPVPDVHGRSGQGTAQQHGNDTAPGGTAGATDAMTGTGMAPGGATGAAGAQAGTAAGGTAGTMGGQTGSGMAAGGATGQPGGTTGDIPATEHQQKLLRTVPDSGQQSGTGAAGGTGQ
jgi:hypothetical protein